MISIGVCDKTTETEAKAMIEPDRMADDVGRIAMTFVADGVSFHMRQCAKSALT